ncbi:MAG: hypothetical protein RX317_00705 [bacterium]|nr:hypothetical protein [bacterium]
MTERTESGRLTEEFLNRLAENKEEVPEILLHLALLQKNLINEVPEPTEKEIHGLIDSIREKLGGLEAGETTLVETCGHEGALCGVCPFGAFIPPEMGFSSQRQPICLPWISVAQTDLPTQD